MIRLWQQLRELIGGEPSESARQVKAAVSDLRPTTESLLARIEQPPEGLTGNIIVDHLTGAAGRHQQEARRHELR